MSHNDLNSQLKIDGSFNRLIENYCVKREAEKQEKTGEKLSEIHLKKEFSEKISKVLDMDELTRKEFADLVINNAVGNSSFKSLLQTKLDFSSRNITVKLEMKNKN
jgi:hypothetical protein